MSFYLDILNNEFLFVLIFFSVVFAFFLLTGLSKSFKNWKTGILFIILLIYFEDLLRKIIPGQPYQVLVLKDILVFVVYCAFLFFIRKEIIFKPKFLFPAILFGAWCIVEIFNPNSPSLWFPLVGIRTYLWYLPLIFLGYYMFSDKKKLIKFCQVLIYTAIPLAVIAILQYSFFYVLPPEFSQPLQTGHEIHYFGNEKIKLIPSIFGSAERFASISFFLFLLGLGLLLFYKDYSKFRKFFLIISIISAFLSIFISGRRTPLYFSLACFLIFFIFYFRNKLMGKISRKKIIITGVILLIFFAALFFIFQDTAKFFAGSLPSIINRLILSIKEVIFSAETAGLWGSGVGTRSQGLHYIPGGENWYNQNIANQQFGIESGIGKVLAELGFIGLILFLVFYGKMIFSWFSELKVLKNTELYSVGFSIVLYLLFVMVWFLKGHQILGDSTTLFLFWFFMGILFNLKNISNGQK